MSDRNGAPGPSFQTRNGVLEHHCDHVHQWRCPVCACWRPIGASRCAICGFSRESQPADESAESYEASAALLEQRAAASHKEGL